jgi:OOP family OmpA-OmpF porin
VKAFSGTIEGIFFELNKATIRPQSRAVLDRAVEVLGEFPSIRMEISGHSDSTGTREHNLDLSARRAEAVKQHLVEHGIAPERLRTRGAGPDEPRADNAIAEGRQKNRRIEFKVLTD